MTEGADLPGVVCLRYDVISTVIEPKMEIHKTKYNLRLLNNVYKAN